MTHIKNKYESALRGTVSMGGQKKLRGFAGAVTLAALIVCAAAAARSARADGAVISIDPPSQNVATDAASFTVNVKLSGASNVGSGEFAIAYDAARLELADVVEGPFLKSDGQPTNCIRSADTAGLVNAAKTALATDTAAVAQYGCHVTSTYATFTGPSGDGILGTITFKPKTNGIANLVFVKRDLGNPGAGAVDVTSADGVVQVGATGGALQPTPTANPAILTPVALPSPEIDPFVRGASGTPAALAPAQSQATSPSGTIASDPTLYGPPAPVGSVLSAGAASGSSDATGAVSGSGGTASGGADSNFPRAGYGPQPSEPDPAWRRAEWALAALGAMLIALGAHKRRRQA